MFLLAAVARPALAQQTREPLVRGDVSATAGWFSASRPGSGWGDDWYHRSLYAGVEGGWYWTDHVKTQVAFGGHTEGVVHRGRPIVIDGLPTWESSQVRFGDRKLTLTAHYQFGRNAWFHPHVGAGADLSWESTTEQIEPVYYFGDPSRVQRALRDARVERRRAFVVRPCVEVGFKAYLSPRAFFRTDLRVRTGSRTDEALIRFGFGTDF